MTLRSVYIDLVHRLRRTTDVVGLLGRWSQLAEDHRWALWSRSLLAIYDLEDLVSLDVPWWTLRASERVEKFLASCDQPRVFEWGSGASTVWLSKRADSVTSVESDARWATDLQEFVPMNCRIMTVMPSEASSGSVYAKSDKKGFRNLDFSNYVESIRHVGGYFDLIVIDGRARASCLSEAVNHLAPRGVIVFDNVERVRYRQQIARVADAFEVEWTLGLTPCLPYPSATALLSRRSRE